MQIMEERGKRLEATYCQKTELITRDLKIVWKPEAIEYEEEIGIFNITVCLRI